MQYQGLVVTPQLIVTNKNIDTSDVTVLIDKNISTCYNILPTKNTGQ